MPLSGPGASPSRAGASRRARPPGRRGGGRRPPARGAGAVGGGGVAVMGSRCVVVEGVRVEEGAVLGANVVLTGSTRIIDVTGEGGGGCRGGGPAGGVAGG